MLAHFVGLRKGFAFDSWWWPRGGAGEVLRGGSRAADVRAQSLHLLYVFPWAIAQLKNTHVLLRVCLCAFV